MRDQKFYKHHIIKKAFGARNANIIRDKYNKYKKELGLSRGNGGNTPRVYQAKILKQVVHGFGGWSIFKEKYENAKSPTANNLPRTRELTIRRTTGVDSSLVAENTTRIKGMIKVLYGYTKELSDGLFTVQANAVKTHRELLLLSSKIDTITTILTFIAVITLSHFIIFLIHIFN